MRVTLKEIAKEAGVHISTVDKVLHNRIGVSDAVRKKVQRIIDEKGYRPNPAGRTLQKIGKQYKIAVILPEVDAAPYIRKGISAWIEENAEFDVLASFHSTAFWDVEGQEAWIRHAIANRADGILLFPKYAERIREAMQLAGRQNIPIVTVNSDLEEGGRLCYIGHDGVRGAKMAGRMMGLLLSGRGKVAIVTSAADSEYSDYHVKTRETEFLSFIAREYPEISVVQRIESLEDKTVTYEKTRRLLEEIPDLTGIYITCGGAAEVGNALSDCGKERDVRVISFEDYPEILKLIDNGIFDCTIGGDLAEQGRMGLQILMEYLVWNKNPERKKIYTESKILVKESFL